MHPPTLTSLVTARLRLRPLQLDDAAFILGLVNEPSFLQHIGDKGVRDLAGAEGYLRSGPLAMYERHGMGLLLVERRGEGEDGTATPIGICGLLQREGLPVPDVGFAFLPAHWGQGYAYEAVSAVLAWGRERLQLSRILAVVAPGNVASRRLLEKLGLRAAGRVDLGTERVSLCLYET